MAETIVRFAQHKLEIIKEKLPSWVGKKMKGVRGVVKKVNGVLHELTKIKCDATNADSKGKGDLKVQKWLIELRDVAYRIEDATDPFFLKDDDHLKEYPGLLQNKPRLFRKLSKLCCLNENPQKVRILNKFGTDLSDIQNLLTQVSKRWKDYGLQNLQDNVGEAANRLIQSGTSQHVDETEFVSLVADKNRIVKLLHATETKRLAVITIVGNGGLGKTTLAHMIYRSARAKFDSHIMLSLPQNINLTDLLTEMLCQLKSSKPENSDRGHLIRELRSTLKEKRYLIILDGLWEVKWWNQLKFAFPDVKNSSRVLITSRSIIVAESAETKTHKLGFLDDEESRKLLLKKAFPYQQPGEECTNDLLELLDKLSKKCENLPLALIVVGGILSTREPSYTVWESVLQTMNWNSEGMNYMDVMDMSYKDMPYYLKPCFLYLASFPKDYEISAKCLIRMWIEEGFIQQKENTTVQEIAENYLDELVQRSIVQVSSRSIHGLIKCCKVRDQLHDLAMKKAKDEKFVTIFSKATNVNQSNSKIRRASFQSCDAQLMEYEGTNIRTVVMFDYLPEWSKFGLLKVLYLVGVKYYTIEPVKGLEKLIQLKFLVIRNCKINNPKGLEKLMYLKFLVIRNCEIENSSSCSLDHMETLENLDLWGTKLELSNALWKICTLRCVKLYGNSANQQANLPIPCEPISIANLKNIQTLGWVLPPRTWDSNLTLTNLRKLSLCMFSADQKKWDTVTRLLEKLSLVSLQLRWHILPTNIFHPQKLPNYQNLKSLYLQGGWPEDIPFEASLFPPCLVKLKLSYCRIDINPMPELGKLKNLIKLYIETDAVIYWGPLDCLEGFHVLRYLKLNDSNIQSLNVNWGAMPKLTYLEVDDKVELHLPPELQYLGRGNVK